MTLPAFAPAYSPELTTPTNEVVLLHMPVDDMGKTLASIGIDGIYKVPQQAKIEAIEEIFSPASIPMTVRYEYCTGEPFACVQTSEYLPATEVADDLGMSLDTLADTLTALNVPNYMLTYDRCEGLLLAPRLNEVIADELSWQGRFAKADGFVTTAQLGELAGGVDETRLAEFIAKTVIDHTKGADGEHTYPKVLAQWLRAETMLAAQGIGADLGSGTDSYDTVMVDEILRHATMRPGHCSPRPDGRLLFEEITVLVGTTRDIARIVLSQLNLGPAYVTELPSTNRGGRKPAGFSPNAAVPIAHGVVEHWAERIDELQKTLRELGTARTQGVSTLTLRQYNAAKLLLAKAQGKHDEATNRLQQLLNHDEAMLNNVAS